MFEIVRELSTTNDTCVFEIVASKRSESPRRRHSRARETPSISGIGRMAHLPTNRPTHAPSDSPSAIRRRSLHYEQDGGARLSAALRTQPASTPFRRLSLENLSSGASIAAIVPAAVDVLVEDSERALRVRARPSWEFARDTAVGALQS